MCRSSTALFSNEDAKTLFWGAPFCMWQSKSSRPDLVFRIKLKYYLLLIVASLRTRRAQCDFGAINILCIVVYEHGVCQKGVANANNKLYTSFWRTSKTIPTWPSKNLFHNSLFRMKRASTTSILSQNNKGCNETNELVKIVISLHCVNPFFSMSNANNRRPLKCTKYLQPKSHIVHVVF